MPCSQPVRQSSYHGRTWLICFPFAHSVCCVRCCVHIGIRPQRPRHSPGHLLARPGDRILADTNCTSAVYTQHQPTCLYTVAKPLCLDCLRGAPGRW